MNKAILIFLLLFAKSVCSQHCKLNLSTTKKIEAKSFCSFTACDDSLAIYEHFPISRIEVKSLKLRWTLFEDNDGTNSIDDDLVTNYMGILNEVFEPYKFRFELFSIETQRNTLVNHASITTWQDSISFYKPYVKHAEDVINILVTKDFDFWDDSAFATFPFDIPELEYTTYPERRGVIVMNQKLLQPDFEGYLSIIPHEFGHLFGLFHVDFYNSECGESCNESVNLDNTKVAKLPYNSGDFIRDTPPMGESRILQELEIYCDNPIDTVITDECTDLPLYDQFPNMTNYMSNFVKCQNHFTEEQTLRMHCFVETYYPQYINNELTSTTKIDAENNYELVPNPATNVIRINSKNSTVPKRMSIYSQQRQLVERFENIESLSMDISSYFAGMYFVIIQGEKATNKQLLKFVKQ